MHPPTPYPASARSRSKIQTEPHDKPFREITARANVVSRSEQDFSSVIKKTEEEVNGKGMTKTPTASRRYSVASKFAGLKVDSNDSISSCTTALEAKPKANKRVSLQGTVCGPPSKGGPCTGTHTSVVASKGTAVLPHAKIPGMPAKKQPPASEQASKLLKPTADLPKRPVSGSEKGPPTHATRDDKNQGTVLKSALYWLEQVKLAEALEKHAVAIGFFCLAVECEAKKTI